MTAPWVPPVLPEGYPIGSPGYIDLPLFAEDGEVYPDGADDQLQRTDDTETETGRADGA